MTSADGKGETRRRGSIRARGGSLQVRVYAGQDPVTGRDRYLSDTVKGTLIARPAGRPRRRSRGFRRAQTATALPTRPYR